MDKLLGTQLDRVETALTTLVDSITSYNPSLTAAQELVFAEDELMLGLEKLQIHQANYLRIESLKAQVAALSSEIKETTSTLAALRQEVLALPVTTAPPLQHAIPYSELLNFATKIAPYTYSPIPLHLPPVQPPADAKTTPSSPHLSNGTNPTPFADQKPQPSFDPPTQPTQSDPYSQPPMATQSLSRNESSWLNPHQNLPFLPWPGDELLSMGGLATIQGMVERGESIEGDEAKNADLDGEMSTPEEIRTNRRRESFNGIGGGRRREERPAVFGGLDLYDPDEDG